MWDHIYGWTRSGYHLPQDKKEKILQYMWFPTSVTGFRTFFENCPWMALSVCDKQDRVNRSPPNEDTKFQYCTIKLCVVRKCFCMRSSRRSSWKHIVSSERRSSLKKKKMNWWLQKHSTFCKKCMVMNVYLVRMFSNVMVSFAMAERAWMMIQEEVPRTSWISEHITKVRAVLS